MNGAAALADEVRGIARRAGLDSVGICDARPFPEVRAELERRKADGLSAGMQFTYRNPDRSTDPSVTLPGARAIVVGARGYHRAPVDDPTLDQHALCSVGVPSARVARYSWIDHYRPLRAALELVAGHLRDQGWQARVLADDNALVDRAAAVRAGLGWWGKNSNVLLPGRGSWFVLGSVVTDAPIAPIRLPEQVSDGCRSCHKCLDDCPTGALVGPGRLDARRCLAWLVQAPGLFPIEYRRALGDRIYGCDDCQERCPVNRRAERANSPQAAEPGSQPSVAVLDLLTAGDVELEQLIGRWYIPGRDLRYVRRNALIVLGNTAEPAVPGVVDALARYLADPDPLLRAHAVWAARRLGRHDLLLGVDGSDPVVAEELGRATV